MKRLELIPDGFPCKFKECPPGFFLKGESVFLKSEYGHHEAYCESGEAFWGGAKTSEERLELEVQPLVTKWVVEEQ